MHKLNRLTVAVLVTLALSLAACEKGSAVLAKPEAPRVVMVGKADPSGIKRITLKEIESKRLGIDFVEVTKTGERLTMPYNALLYDPSGGEWAFAGIEPNVYARTALKVEAIEGDKVYLSSGPAVGTKLVTNGAAELYGIEFGVGK
jgi:hypothetical protein